MTIRRADALWLLDEVRRHEWVECGFNYKCRRCDLLWCWGTSRPADDCKSNPGVYR